MIVTYSKMTGPGLYTRSQGRASPRFWYLLGGHARKIFRYASIALTLFLFVPPHPLHAEPVLDVLPFELYDLSLRPGLAAEVARTESLQQLLVEKISQNELLRARSVDVDVFDKANASRGYLFDKPERALPLAISDSTTHLLVNRLHKASFLFVYLMCKVIDSNTGETVADLVVEVKGTQPKLTAKGADSLARQIETALSEKGLM